MEVTYYYCTPNNHLALLQRNYGDVTWTLSDLLTFLRCLPQNYIIYEKEIRSNDGDYYIVYDIHLGAIFYVYLKNPIKVVILRSPNATEKIVYEYVNFNSVSNLYMKKENKNIKVNVYEIQLILQYQMLGTKHSTTHLKLSDASFSLLKKLARLYPTSPEIAAEKMKAIDSYSYQQKLNIYNNLTIDIDLITLLKTFKGIVKVFVHSTTNPEIPYDKSNSVHGLLWIAPWAFEAICKFQYLELDGTFELAKPYTLACPQIIVNGLALPLGFILGPSENWTLFDVFYEELMKIMGNRSLLSLPVLSDQGKGIEKFCKQRKIVQYWCIRHIINIVGANSFLGKLTGKLLMSQTPEEFDKHYADVLKMSNSYNENLKNKTINEKFLAYCFLRLNEKNEIVENIVDQKLFDKIVLFNRDMVAAASNHAEGFHSKLKKIANEGKGFVNNISKLYELMNKRLEKYVSGLSADKQCTRIKKMLLEKQKLYNIVPSESCDCDSNHHLELIVGKLLPCIHTIKETTIISMNYPLLDEKKFINGEYFSIEPSRFEGVVSFGTSGRPGNLSKEENLESAVQKIEDLLVLRKQFVSLYNTDAFDDDAARAFREIMLTSVKLGLPITKLEDFSMFLVMDFLACNFDLQIFIENKCANIGRYFALNRIE